MFQLSACYNVNSLKTLFRWDTFFLFVRLAVRSHFSRPLPPFIPCLIHFRCLFNSYSCSLSGLTSCVLMLNKRKSWINSTRCTRNSNSKSDTKIIQTENSLSTLIAPKLPVHINDLVLLHNQWHKITEVANNDFEVIRSSNSCANMPRINSVSNE